MSVRPLVIGCLLAGALASSAFAAPASAARADAHARALSASELCARSVRLQTQRRWAEADSVAALAATLAARGGPDSALVLARALVERCWVAQGRHKRVAPEVMVWAESALAIRSARLAPGHEDRRDAFHLMGTLDLEGERYESATRWFALQVAECRAMNPPDSVALAGAITGVASVLYRRGLFRDAAVALDTAIAVYDAQARPDSGRLANALNGRASSWWQAGDLDAAERDDARSLALRLALGAPEVEGVAQTLTNIGSKRFVRGDYEGALEYHRRAVEVYRGALGADTPAAGWPLGGMGFDLNALSRWAEARECVQQAIALLERERGPRHSLVTAQLLPLADIQIRQRDFEGALATARRVHETRMATLAPDHPLQADPYEVFGRIYHAMGRLAEARAYFDTTIILRERGFGAQSGKAAKVRGARARVELAMGDTAAAITDLRRKREDLARERGAGHPEVAEARIDLAMIDVRGDSATVLGEMRAALDSIARANGTDYPELGEWRALVAREMASRGDVRGAIWQGLESERVRRRHFHLVVNGLGEHDALNTPGRESSGWGLATRLLARSGTTEEGSTAFDQLVRSRAEWLDELAERHRAAGAADSAVAALAHEFSARCSELSRLVLAGAADAKPGAYAERLARLQSRRDSAEARLAAANPVYERDRNRRAIGAGEVIAALPRGAALVSYARAGGSYVAHLVAPGAAGGAWIEIGAAGRVDSLVTEWRRSFVPGAPAKSWLAGGARLREVIWKPVERRLRGAAQVYVVADGELLRVPFAALPGEGGVPLLERGPLVRMLGCERDLVAESAPRRGTLRLAVGGPDFEAGERAAAGSARVLHPGVVAKDIRFSPLPGAAAEAAEVARVWRADGRAGEVRELAGPAASESALRELAPRASVLHVATHGFYLDQRSEPALGTRGIGGLAPPEPEAQPGAEPAAVVYASPLVRSGLALARANGLAAASDGADDGVLTAEEIATLDLQSVECAVLSACQTGDGEIVASEGVVGLARAFRIAGARSLVTSLWPVDDAATREWMVEFHRARGRFGGDAALAVREASRLTRRARLARGQEDSPFYWAAFTAQGR